MYPERSRKILTYSRSLAAPHGLSAAWYEELLQTGTALYSKYQVYKDTQKQKKAAVEYSNMLEEQSRLKAIQQVQIQAQAAKIPIKTVTTIAGINAAYVLAGGAAIAAMLLLRK